MRHPQVLGLLLVGCVQGGVNFEGVGTVYHTRCSASMDARGEEYFARCTPPACAEGFVAGAINHVAVSVDPGKKVVGYAERPCLQEPRLEAAGPELPPPAAAAPAEPERATPSD